MQIVNYILVPVKEVLKLLGLPLFNLLSAVVLLLAGYFLAAGLRWLVMKAADLLQIDKGCKKMGISALLIKGGVKRTLSELSGDLVYWFILLASALLIVSAMGLTAAQVLAITLVAYLPVALSAVFILGLGIILANFIGGVVSFFANLFDPTRGKFLGGLVQYAIIVYVFLLALNQIGMSLEWFVSSISIVIGGIVLALAIAFGIVGQKKAAKVLDKLFSK